jgi:hypothetical protein
MTAPVITVHVGIGGQSSSGGGGGDPTPVNPLTVTLASPEDQSTVAIANPTFVVGVDTSFEDPTSEYQLILQYADNAAITNPATQTVQFDAVDAGAFITPTAVPATTYWRARVAQGSTWRSAWSDIHSFTVDNNVTPAICPVTWTVDDSAARPIHLWHLVPPAAAPGDQVTAFGQGFPDPGHVQFDGAPVNVTSWQLVDQQPGNPTADRIIDLDDVFPEHYEVVFTVPDYTGPGAALVVTT